MTDQTVGFLVSCALHGAIMFGTAGVVTELPKYDVESGSGGTEVSLIAAPAQAQERSNGFLNPVVNKDEETSGEQDLSAQVLPPAAQTQPVAAAGDGSSPVPGQDPTTFYLPGGAASGTGGRFKNPAPAYPYQAIRQNQQGLVILEVHVDKGGRPTEVSIHQSSGYVLLDQSALWTVRRWKFDPAHVGWIPANAKIRVPVRFMLDKNWQVKE